ASATSARLSLIPGAAYLFFDGGAGFFPFQVDAAGVLQGLPASFDGRPVSGSGTRRLLIGGDTALVVTGASPPNDALEVSIAADVTVSLSAPTDPATVTDSSVRLLG